MKKIISFIFVFLITATTAMLHAQDMNISGKVTDTSGEAMPGVSIRVKGTTNGTSTDFDGNYQIKASNGNVLVFSYMGYITQEITVKQNVINVSLVESTSQLDEVVITAHGIKKEAKSLGFAVQQVNSDDLELVGKNNGLEALQGQVAGLRINRTSGSAGGGVDMLIRGVTSVDPTRNNQPLIIIDGMPVNNDTFSGDVKPIYAVGSAPLSGDLSKVTSAIDPVNGKYLFGSCTASSNLSDISPDVFAGKHFGVKKMKLTGCYKDSNTASRGGHFGFDYLGRLHVAVGSYDNAGVDMFDEVATRDCNLTIKMAESDDIIITIESETGHAFIVGQEAL